MRARVALWATVLSLGSLAFAGCSNTTTGASGGDAGIDAARGDAAAIDGAIDAARGDDTGVLTDGGSDDAATVEDAATDEDASAEDAATSDDASGPPGTCATNADCTALELCAAPACGAMGTCVVRPVGCIAVIDPVCGCDGMTYGNACEAEAMGVNVAMRGACPVGGCALTPAAGCCFEDGDCGSRSARCVGEACAGGGEGTCVTNLLGAGACWEDTDCNAGETCDGASVCGCGLRCLLPDAPGRCRPAVTTACTTNADCGAAAYCARAAGDCGAMGGCTARPLGCSRILDPVCGCDGTTYDNPCLAASAGVSVASSGACSAACARRPAAGCCFDDGDCTGRTRCVGEMCTADGEGTCVSAALSPGQCWESSDCARGVTCTGASVCPCGAACLLPDRPGTCGGIAM